MRRSLTIYKLMSCPICEMFRRYPDLIIREDDDIVVLHSPHPFSNGHLVITSKRHIAFGDMRLLSTLLKEASRLVRVLSKAYSPHGFNVGIRLSPHLCIEVVPRWNGDVSFNVLFGGFKVVPLNPRQAVEELRRFNRE